VKEKLTAFIDALNLYDYLFFGGVFFVFLLFILITILLRKHIFLALLFLLSGFTLVLLSPTLGYKEFHTYLYKNKITLLSYKKLHFSDAVVIEGNLTNESKFDFTECTIYASVFKVTKNKYKNILYKLKPLKKMTIVQTDIKKKQTRYFKMIIDPFTYEKDFNVTIGSLCR